MIYLVGLKSICDFKVDALFENPVILRKITNVFDFSSRLDYESNTYWSDAYTIFPAQASL